MEVSTTNSTPSNDENGAEYSSCETGYRFDSVRGETTIVTEWGLICERRYLLPLSTTLYFCGVVIGAWIAGVLSDRVGRLPVLAICLYTQGTLAVALYVIQDYRTFLVVRALQGVFVQGLHISTYTLLLELFPVRTRTLVGMASQFAWALGLALLAGLSYAVADWRILQLATSVPTAVTVLYIWIIPESPRWLLAKGKLTEAHMALEKIVKYNTCCRKNQVQVEPEIEEANVTTNTESVTPVKPKRKSRIANVDPNETKTSDILPEEARNLLSPLENSEVKISEQNNLLTPSESLERRISNLELQLELDVSRVLPKEEIEDSTLPSAPPTPNENDSPLSNTSEGNQEVLDPEVLDEMVELRTAEMVSQKSEDIRETDGGDMAEKKNEDIERKTELSTNHSFTQLLRHQKLRINCLVMIFVWFSVSLTYCGWIVHLPNLSGDRHVDFAISASFDLVAYVITYFILIKFGRRIPLSIYLILSGCVCIVAGAVSMPIHKNGSWTGPTKFTLILFGKGLIVSSFAVIYLYTVEIFPTVLRGTGLGYCEISSKIGSLIAPQILLLGPKTSVAVPISLMGTLCVVSGILSLVLPEMMDKPLMDTIEQCENLSIKYRPRSNVGDDEPARKTNNKRHTVLDEQTERDILREKLFSDENGGKTWVDAGNGIIVNFSDSRSKNTAE